MAENLTVVSEEALGSQLRDAYGKFRASVVATLTSAKDLGEVYWKAQSLGWKDAKLEVWSEMVLKVKLSGRTIRRYVEIAQGWEKLQGLLGSTDAERQNAVMGLSIADALAIVKDGKTPAERKAEAEKAEAEKKAKEQREKAEAEAKARLEANPQPPQNDASNAPKPEADQKPDHAGDFATEAQEAVLKNGKPLGDDLEPDSALPTSLGKNVPHPASEPQQKPLYTLSNAVADCVSDLEKATAKDTPAPTSPAEAKKLAKMLDKAERLIGKLRKLLSRYGVKSA